MRNRWLAAGALCALAAAVVYVLSVWTWTGQVVENRALDRAMGPGPATDLALAALSLVGSPPLILAAFALIALTGALTRTASARRRVRFGVAGAGVAMLSVAITEVLKYGLPRPLLDDAGAPLHNSFPSGHTTVAAGVAFGLMLALPPRLRVPAMLPLGAAVALIGGLTVLTGWHRVSDIAGSVLVSAALFCAAGAWLGLPETLQKGESRETPDTP
ncbi:hypothetical protein Afil01_21520 [Actinorhabdospora filicis]|uniref:Phosphatidic acid phosphatase type 2/haloperoxidase domain-containing protein n=1 Tax=Actinorhabdospora filicis TaxID=1785913 RepID=A0A9W6WA72_9ACTN|nr:phosphatase PAP2 family protein [Actinorhabdospora filicis]GLZ77345.1 hypothetical protein Afil01_21520 [Actinorhabdospora filicis]